MKRLILVLMLVLLGAPPTIAQSLEMRIFQLNNRPAEATVPMVEPLLSEEGSVLPETRLNKLIVRDTPEVLSEVEALLKEIDQPAPQVRIHVSMNGISPYTESAAGVSVSGDIRHPRVAGTAYTSSGSASANARQNLLVMSGERGVITVGQNIVNTSPYVQFAVGAGLLPPGAVFQNVSTGFAVEPTVVGDVVRLRITPWMGFAGGAGRQEVLFNEASSTVAVKSGRSVSIASSSEQRTQRSGSFGLVMGSATRTSSSSGDIVVRPVIEQPYPTPSGGSDGE